MRNNDELFQGVQMACAVCGDVERHCEPVCQACLANQATETELQRRGYRLAQELLEWAEEYRNTWVDGSDAEVALDEILEEARLLVPPENLE
jgi:hypothetical protein